MEVTKNERDNRIDYMECKWMQGECLSVTGYNPETDWKKRNAREHCTLYAKFYSSDMGRGRIFLYKFNTAAECLKEVTEHNRNLKMIKLLMPKEDLIHFSKEGEDWADEAGYIQPNPRDGSKW